MSEVKNSITLKTKGKTEEIISLLNATAKGLEGEKCSWSLELSIKEI